MAPKTVRMVLLEGESAGGVTVDEDTFDVAPESAAAATADQVIAAILGTQESAAERGHQLQSSGVTWTDPVEADALRDALAAHKIENVAGSGGWVAQPPAIGSSGPGGSGTIASTRTGRPATAADLGSLGAGTTGASQGMGPLGPPPLGAWWYLTLSGHGSSAPTTDGKTG